MDNISVNRDAQHSDEFSVAVGPAADGVCRVIVKGELDIATAPLLQEALSEAESTSAKIILLDLEGLDFMDSTGLVVLIQAAARARSDSDRLRITRPTGPVARLLSVADAWEELPWVAPGEGSP